MKQQHRPAQHAAMAPNITQGRPTTERAGLEIEGRRHGCPGGDIAALADLVGFGAGRTVRALASYYILSQLGRGRTFGCPAVQP